MILNKRLPEKGFTLMEVVTVVVIFSVVAVLFFVKFEHSIERVRSADAIGILQALREAQEIYKLENGVYTSTVSSLEVRIPATSDYFATPQVSSTDASALVSIVRNSSNFKFGTAYTFKITSTGTVTCSGSTYCTRLGF